MEKSKYYLVLVLAVIVAFLLGCLYGRSTAPASVKEAVKQVGAVKGKVETSAKTSVAYVPKKYVEAGTAAEPEPADVDVNIGKQDLHVKVNGEMQTFKKADNEQFVFDKNKLELTQQSTATIDIKVPVIDKTKRNAIGYGLNSHGSEELTYRHRFSDKWGFYVRGEGSLFKGVGSEVKFDGAGVGVEYHF